MLNSIEHLLSEPPEEAGMVNNERAFQLELAYYFRCLGATVEFEKFFNVKRPAGSTRKPKSRLDLLVTWGSTVFAFELKVPLNGRHPETFYDFCADIEFVEAMVLGAFVEFGYCLLMTNDQVFWKDGARGSDIHHYFRRPGAIVTGRIAKPTGSADSTVVLTGTYKPSQLWRLLTATKLMENARYLLIEVDSEHGRQARFNG